MKHNLNEVKRMQQLAGLNESQHNEVDYLAEIRQLVRETISGLINEEEYDLQKDRERGAVPFPVSPNPTTDYDVRSQKAMQSMGGGEITDFSKGAAYMEKVFTIKGMRDLILSSNTFEDFEAAVKAEIGNKVSRGVLRKLYTFIKD